MGVKVLNAAFANTFQYMPPELMGTISEMHGVINQAYQKEVDKFTQNSWNCEICHLNTKIIWFVFL